MSLIAIPQVFADNEPDIGSMLDRIGETNIPDPTRPLPATTTSLVNVEVQWQLWQRVLADGNPGLTELETLHNDAISVGLPSLPHHQLALLHTSHSAEEHGLDELETRRLIEKAHDLAPHLPYAQLELAHWRLKTDLTAPHRVIPPYFEGLQLSYQWLDTRLGWTLKAGLLLLIALGLGFIGFLLAQLLRYFGIAAYDGTRLLPRGFSSTQTVVLLVAIVLVPGLILQSPLLSMVLLLLLITPFQQLNERVVAFFFFALIAALPWLDDQIGELVTYPGSDAQQLLHAHYHGCDEDCRTWLEDLAEDDDGVAAYIERVDLFRSASQEDMVALEDWFFEHDLSADDRLTSHWLNFEGAVLIARGKSAEALDVLAAAAAADPTSAAPWFNTMRAYQILDDEDASHDALEHAFGLDLWGTSRQLDLSRRTPHSFLRIDFLSSDVIWQDHRPGSENAPSLVTPLWTIAAGEKMKLHFAPWLGLTGILFLLITLPLYIARRVSSPCPKCGLARDPTETSETGHHHYCRPCYLTFVSGSTMDYHARVHSEATLGRRDRLQAFLRRTFSLLAPGVGHIMGGHAIRGTLTICALLTGIFLLIYPMGPLGTWRGAFELFRVNWAGQAVLAWILISIAASVGLTGLLRGVEATRPRTSSKKSRGSQ